MKKIIVLLGPTGVGKTTLSIDIAESLHTSIISADSRQFYRGIEIGTAAPTTDQLRRVKHHLIGMLDLEDYYNASEFENDALEIISSLHKESDEIIVTGGSMMYIDALCNGIDKVPNIDENIRRELYDLYEHEGLDPIRSQLRVLDPEFYQQVDLKNYKRVIHALEVCLTSGKPYSSFRTRSKKKRSFDILKIGLMRDREDLYNRINLRVDNMIKNELLEEAKKVYAKRKLNSLNTVGYKELFKYIDKEWTLDFAIEKIKQNTRIYSRKQMTWFKRDSTINWINLSALSYSEVIEETTRLCQKNN